MGYATFAFVQVTTGGGQIHGGRSGPHEPHRHLGIEIEAACASGRRERRFQRCCRINAKAEEGIIDAGADTNARTAFGATPLLWSTASLAKVKLLVEKGADVNAITGPVLRNSE